MTRGGKKYADLGPARQAVLDSLIAKSNNEATMLMFAMFQVSEMMGLDDWKRQVKHLAAHILRVHIALNYRDIKRGPDISDRAFYHMLVDQATQEVGDFLKSEPEYKDFSRIATELLRTLHKM